MHFIVLVSLQETGQLYLYSETVTSWHYGNQEIIDFLSAKMQAQKLRLD